MGVNLGLFLGDEAGDEKMQAMLGHVPGMTPSGSFSRD
jgi:hypothetical protein